MICPMCGLTIGGPPHQLARAKEGARRIMSPLFVDNSNFYIGYFLSLHEFWDAQRCYIQNEINRMKLNSVCSMTPLVNGKPHPETHNLKGFNMLISNGRISPITSKFLILMIENLLYSFVSLDLIKNEEYSLIFSEAPLNK